MSHVIELNYKKDLDNFLIVLNSTFFQYVIIGQGLTMLSRIALNCDPPSSVQACVVTLGSEPISYR